ncbi:hypothetical protein [Heyndrickxia coagulans]|uniref:Uncharacterized protein n=1 Tax=Heyndrickxia coagulans TaxID=1398 RepID=A0A150JRE5_HEYCO|nr:hypothetical protein [Heyndrickxia coagulans]KYC59668.1 hypothetical protein B4098_0042 [Heyndrickxia coagulans]MCR2845210.1 hypothetical protein [Heyndrickxia coagulans]
MENGTRASFKAPAGRNGAAVGKFARFLVNPREKTMRIPLHLLPGGATYTSPR